MSLEARIVAVLEAIGLDMGAVQAGKVDKVSGKQLSTEDFTSAEKTKLSGIAAGAQVNAVTSVAGRTGAVVLAKADVGLGSVDNTADTAKPVSTAQQTALNLKANLASPALTGTPTAPTATAGTNTTQVATTAFVQAAASAATPSASTSVAGKVELATDAETQAGTDAARAVTPAALASAAFGMNQTWQLVTRAVGTTYTNTTGRPICVLVRTKAGSNTSIYITATVDGLSFVIANDNSPASPFSIGSFVVPPGSTYSFAINSAGLHSVHELR